MTLVERLRSRRISGMHRANQWNPKDWSIELKETDDPLCVEAADRIEALEAVLDGSTKAIEWLLETFCKDERWRGVDVYDNAMEELARANALLKPSADPEQV